MGKSVTIKFLYMTAIVAKKATAKKHQVFVGTELKKESNNPEETLQTVNELQKENVAEFQLVNHVAKVTHVYKKGRYEKNYRVTKGEYVAPSKAVSEEESVE